MRESEVEKYLIQEVVGRNGSIRKVKWIGRRGAPDRFVMLPFSRGKIGYVWIPRCAWVELKRPKGKAEAHQRREHQRLREFGQVVYVIDTKEKVNAFIEGRL